MIYSISGKRGFNDVFDCMSCNEAQSLKKRRKFGVANKCDNDSYDNSINIKFESKQQIQTTKIQNLNDQKLQGKKRCWITQDTYVMN